MMVVGYYTQGEGTSYEAEAELLRASLVRAGVPHEITAIESRGDWYANTSMKAEFIRRQREEHAGALLYVDVDAFVHRDPSAYFDTLNAMGSDFGAHYFRGPAGGHDRSKVEKEGWRLLSGTLYFGDTPGARVLLNAWVALNATLRAHGAPEGGGQKNLWYLTTCLRDIEVVRLPGSYCWVFDKPWAYAKEEEPVIEHTIASRDHRGTRQRTDARAQRIEQLQRLVGA